MTSTYLVVNYMAIITKLWSSCKWELMIPIKSMIEVENGHGETMEFNSSIGFFSKLACFWYYK